MTALRTLVIGLGLALATTASAEIYRWTDDSGETHFGSNPPMDVDAERVEQRMDSRPANDDTDSSNSSASGDEDTAAADEQAEGDDAGASDEESDEDNNQELAEACDAAEQSRDVYSDESVRRVRTPDGEVERITPEEREERLEEATSFLDENC
ncbi:MAG: DUF4124 domain-containing protein [Ectothiorhodospiraceae bacterium]